MPTELDQAIEGAFTELTQKGAPLETVGVEKDGVTLPMLARAPATLIDYFAHFCAQHNDAEFLVDGDLRLSFAEVHAAARTLAGGLVEGYGLQKGERVGIAARNSANWIVSYMAILMAGGVATLLNGWWQGGEFAEAVRMVGCRLVLADDRRAEKLAGQDLDGAEIIEFAHDVAPLEGLSVLTAKGGGADTVLPQVTADDHATILFTSGSTGRAKGAYSTHRAVVQGTMCYVGGSMMLLKLVIARGQPPKLAPCTLLNVPLFHVTAEIPIMMQSFAVGRKLVLMPKWDAEEAMRLIEKEKITYFTGVPLMSIEIATHPKRGDYDLTSCTMMAAGGAPRPVEHVKRIQKAMPWGMTALGYGLTETNAVGCTNFADNYLAKPDSTGVATPPLVDMAIIDDDGNHMAQGERGEVCIRTIANFEGYWNDEEATRAAFTDDRYFRTGDIGYVDEDGYLFIVDRKKDIIIRGGENISCPEVEAAGYEHDDVAELSVFGIADERYGEVPGLVYYPREGSEVTPDALSEFLKQRLAAFKVPQHIWLAPAPLPRLGTQKIDRVTLRKQYNAVAVGDRAA